MSRFARTELLLGTEAMQTLARTRVLVAGLGAVGSYAVEALARAGVGFLRLVDFDVVHPSNLNRQLYALESTLDQPKVEVAAARVKDINPACTVEALRVFVEADTLPDILAPPLDVIIDAIDSLNPKIRLLQQSVQTGESVQTGAFVVSSMGAATRTDPSAIRTGDIAQTRGCPLARLIRKQLRKLGVHEGIHCVYSTETPRNRVTDAARMQGEEEGGRGPENVLRRGRDRTPLGSVSFLTGIFGLVAAREAVARVLGWDG
jgi:tRNA A37 threonylcarbamoyladenosine dehydratase